ncbi:hypothetical protein HELRODRAFT_181106 [Helobdella robusta]|uniref:Dynamin-type G domain-containing protein n=1 Tax=Helobdella robusta TaxID=6412 RepID=T1FGM1_HELRO|nr:hypothetical protein HELRODRAFT_181106 [Helobdella robusta]ESN93360.1 hypothetical protein HELRODRAFT_181106 [Helobdella robusta]
MSSSSSLKFFSEAKILASEIVTELLDVINSNDEIADNHQQKYNIFDEAELKNFTNFIEKLNLMSDIFKRNSMKVAFFGRTSNGKSTVINAMLRDKILPSGLGHTTNCFVQVEGTDSKDVYIIMEDGSRNNIQSLGQLAHALSKVRLSSDSLLRIAWPKVLCPLLQDDVIFVDSPGIDLSADVDKWISKFCLDADVFVLVANAESTLMQTKIHLTRVQVKQQHLERCSAFLVDELKVMTSSDVGRRIFFISALEMLEQYVNISRSSSSCMQKEGFQERLNEFAYFENCFKECISKTAVKTKFGHHMVNLRDMTDALTTSLESAFSERTQQHNELECRLNEILNSNQGSHAKMELTIRQASEELKHKLLSTLRREMRQLEGIIDEYDRVFNPSDLEVMRLYRKDLSFHVEENLSKNLHIKFTPMAKNILVTAGHNMIESIKYLLPDEKQATLDTCTKPLLEFEVIYNLNCSGLCSDFMEDLEFHFSLGLSTLLTKFIGSSHMTDDELTDTLLKKTTSSTKSLPFASKSAIGVLAVLSLFAKLVGSRFIFTCLSLYGVVYMYERVTWSLKAKEKAFKRQYITHIREQLRNVMHILCSNCSCQIERLIVSVLGLSELDTLRKEIERMVSAYQEELAKHLQECKRDCEVMDQLRATSLSNKSSLFNISNHLERFKAKFIS